MLQANFQNVRVAAFESRLAEAMEASIRKYGGDPLVAPSLQEIPLSKHPEAFQFAEKLFSGKVDMVIFMTGVGTERLLAVLETQYPREELVQAFSRLTVVARGPKPTKALKGAGIAVTLSVPEPNTWREILETLETDSRGIDLEGKSVAIQEYGVENPQLIQALKKRGAHVFRIPVYKWGLPDDTAPLKRVVSEVINGKIHVALFTNAAQAHHLLRVAAEEGFEAEFKKAFQRVVIASIGSVCSEAIAACGFFVDFEPSRPKMGIFVSEAAQESARLLSAKQKGAACVSFIKRFPSQEQNVSLRYNSVFLKACRREKTPYTPVWLMRQAGRYMKDYREVRNRVSFLELCRNPELVAEVTIVARRKLNADAAILFSDILLIVQPMGLGLEYLQGDGPVISGEIQKGSDVDRLLEVDPKASLHFVFDGIRMTRASLEPDIPLIGFSGAPFTLAAYMLEGGSSKNFLKAKQFMYQDPGAWRALMEKISRGLIRYLNAQIEAGVDALQIFDSWVGCLTPEDYRQFVMPYTQAVIKGVQGKVPVIHFGTGTASFLEVMRDAGGDVIGLDFHVSLGEAWQRLGDQVGVQGNLDPAALYAPLEFLQEKVKRILTEAAGRPGHIFNLGHGILPTTPEDHAVALIDYVHEFSQKGNLREV